MKTTQSKSDGAFWVAAGIFLSRISGLLRDRVLAHYFGNSLAGDAFRAAWRIPNFLQNLFGEGVLSASFIPLYANLIAREDKQEAQKLAGAILTWLVLMVSVLVLVGVSCTTMIIDLIAPGFTGERRELTIQLVQVFFPGTGLLVIAAWCLGVLNSHRRFFIPYVAPVMCNLAMMASLLMFGLSGGQNALAIKGAWGFVAGTGLQLLVQLPTTLKLVGALRLGLGLRLRSVRTVLTNFLPVVVARGVVQISAYIDTMLASLLPTGALSALAFAQTLYMLPVSLFAMSISASQLPAMSSHQGSDTAIAEALRAQLQSSLRRIAFLVVPSMVAFLALGDVIVGAIYQSGKFTGTDTRYVWWVLCGYSVGLIATTQGRLYSSTFYALRDTRTPLKFALVRVTLATSLGYLGAIQLAPLLGLSQDLGTVGLTLATGLSGWVEYALLKRKLSQRIGHFGIPFRFWLQIGAAAAVATSVGVASHLFVNLHPLLQIATVLLPFGVIYVGVAAVLQVPEAQIFLRQIRRQR